MQDVTRDERLSWPGCYTYVDHERAVARLEFVVVGADVAAVDWHCPVYVARLQVSYTDDHAHAPRLYSTRSHLCT